MNRLRNLLLNPELLSGLQLYNFFVPSVLLPKCLSCFLLLHWYILYVKLIKDDYIFCFLKLTVKLEFRFSFWLLFSWIHEEWHCRVRNESESEFLDLGKLTGNNENLPLSYSERKDGLYDCNWAINSRLCVVLGRQSQPPGGGIFCHQIRLYLLLCSKLAIVLCIVFLFLEM